MKCDLSHELTKWINNTNNNKRWTQTTYEPINTNELDAQQLYNTPQYKTFVHNINHYNLTSYTLHKQNLHLLSTTSYTTYVLEFINNLNPKQSFNESYEQYYNTYLQFKQDYSSLVSEPIPNNLYDLYNLRLLYNYYIGYHIEDLIKQRLPPTTINSNLYQDQHNKVDLIDYTNKLAIQIKNISYTRYRASNTTQEHKLQEFAEENNLMALFIFYDMDYNIYIDTTIGSYFFTIEDLDNMPQIEATNINNIDMLIDIDD